MPSPSSFPSLGALVAIVLSSACSTGESTKPAATPTSTQPETKQEASRSFDLDALLAREADDLREVALSGQGFRARALAKGTPEVSGEDDFSKLVLPIGSEAPVHCFVYEDDPDPGSALSAIAESLSRELDLSRVVAGEVLVVREAPVATLTGYYTTDTPQGRAIGELKIAFHSRLGASSMCLHDELGYEKTFLRVARSVFESLDRETSLVTPSYVEIAAAEVNGRPAGYERLLVLPAKDGERKLVATGLALLISEPNLLVTQDYAALTTVDASDRIVNARFTEAKNGKLSLEVELRRAGGKSYEFRGNRAGQAVSGRLSADDAEGLPSQLWTQRELARRLAGGGAFEFSIQQYRPSEDATALSRIGYVRRSSDPPGTVLVRTGKVEALSLLDARGREQRSEMNTQGFSVVMKSIYRRGE
jgi:hypothetical protein